MEEPPKERWTEEKAGALRRVLAEKAEHDEWHGEGGPATREARKALLAKVRQELRG